MMIFHSNCFLSFSDDRHSDLDIDLDDSDDELLETPSFLRDLENAM